MLLTMYRREHPSKYFNYLKFKNLETISKFLTNSTKHYKHQRLINIGPVRKSAESKFARVYNEIISSTPKEMVKKVLEYS